MFDLRDKTTFRQEILLPGDMVAEADAPVRDRQEAQEGEDQVPSAVAVVGLVVAGLQEDGDENSRNLFTKKEQQRIEQT